MRHSYPFNSNPTRRWFVATLAALTLSGALLASPAQPLQAGPNQFAVPTAGLSNGIYQLVVYVNQQASATQRVAVAN